MFFMRVSTVHTPTNKKNTIYLRLSLVVLLGWISFLSGYMFQPVYVNVIDSLASVYHNSFPSEQMEKKEPIMAVITPGSTEKELIEEVTALKQEKNQEVILSSYYEPTIESTTENEVKYIAETTSEGIKFINFYHNATAVSDTTLSKQWDVSENNFDLVSGVLTIQLTIEEGLSTLDILTQSKGLVGLLMTYNAEKEIQAIELEIESGKENYSFESVKADTLVNTKMIYIN